MVATSVQFSCKLVGWPKRLVTFFIVTQLRLVTAPIAPAYLGFLG